MSARARPSHTLLLAELDARFRLPLMAYFQRRGAPRAEAEDLTQEVFLRIARRPEEDAELVDGFIFTVAANLLRDQARRKKSRSAYQHLSLENDNIPEDGGVALIETCEPERILLSREVLARVLRALDSVPPRTRDIFLLFRLEGMKQREIAQLHGVSVSAVEKHIVKALNRLARELA